MRKRVERQNSYERSDEVTEERERLPSTRGFATWKTVMRRVKEVEESASLHFLFSLAFLCLTRDYGERREPEREEADRS